MHRFIHALARLTALVGGLVLIALIALVSISITGRWFGVGEITGTYELLEAGVAFAIFSFLPITQFYGAHATVDVFTMALPDRVTRWIKAFWEVVLALVILLIIWRLFEGMQRYIGNGETTFFLQFPVWWGYAASFASGLVACTIAIYCAFARIKEAVLGQNILPSEQESA
ncbi:TRAP transporter small permease [uncultured Sulfitobacter sp.]|uniref:TRAP transporter small permease n=1 Tax=uncultured Sulfitobacter sp. TaxID=191468 RepID=UPI0026053264|nr:TRAP transporter small permease [uncultured Sulfitobacter sp.]